MTTQNTSYVIKAHKVQTVPDIIIIIDYSLKMSLVRITLNTVLTSKLLTYLNNIPYILHSAKKKIWENNQK